jgi:superfamily II DNA or RNA helicase
MEYTPYDYQIVMRDWLLAHKQAALFCSPGLGKTLIDKFIAKTDAERGDVPAKKAAEMDWEAGL